MSLPEKEPCTHEMLHSMYSLEELAAMSKEPTPHKVKCLDYKCKQEMYLSHAYVPQGQFQLVRRNVISASIETVTVPVYILRRLSVEWED